MLLMVVYAKDIDWHWAWRTLFPGETPPRAEELKRFAASRMRAAFRKQVRVVHPDHAMHRRGHTGDAASEFRGVVAAYDCLRAAADSASRVESQPPSDAVDPPGSASRCPQSLPQRPLALAQLLFHLNRIPSEAVFESLRWQREQRLALGAVAVHSGYLSDVDVRRVLLARVGRERFGECAMRLGMLTQAEVRSLLLRQRTLQPRVGTYFVTSGFITPSQLGEALRLQQRHNQSVRRPLTDVAA
jgi:hypothetical protein